MKKSELKEAIREEIISVLSEASDEDIANQKKLNDEMANTKTAAQDINKELEEPTASQLKGDSVSTLASKLQDTSSELKSTSKKYKETTDTSEKAELMDRLKKLTAIKKEIESLLEHKK